MEGSKVSTMEAAESIADALHPYTCPDCGCRLSKKKLSGRYHCDNPDCPVIYVNHATQKYNNKINKIVRAAIPQSEPPNGGGDPSPTPKSRTTGA